MRRKDEYSGICCGRGEHILEYAEKETVLDTHEETCPGELIVRVVSQTEHTLFIGFKGTIAQESACQVNCCVVIQESNLFMLWFPFSLLSCLFLSFC